MIDVEPRVHKQKGRETSGLFAAAVRPIAHSRLTGRFETISFQNGIIGPAKKVTLPMSNPDTRQHRQTTRREFFIRRCMVTQLKYNKIPRDRFLPPPPPLAQQRKKKIVTLTVNRSSLRLDGRRPFVD